MKLIHDLHIHTYLSACCDEKEAQTPRRILDLAAEMGVGTIGFADHLWANPNLEPSNWYRAQDGSQISKLRADLGTVLTGIRVLVGCEAEMIAPGKFGITREFARQLDFVLLSCSHFHMRDFVAQPAIRTPRGIAEHMLAFFNSGVSSGLATSIAHPLIPYGYLEHFDQAVDSLTDRELSDSFGAAAGAGVAIEITVGFLRAGTTPGFSAETPLRLLSLAKQAGCKFTLGTDAHGPVKQKRLPELAGIMEKAGIGETDLLILPGGS